jgi:cytochrome c oxidase subunit 1
MGVVFGLFSAFYYWLEFFLGYKFSDYLGRLHFWLTFVGVNLTFFSNAFFRFSWYAKTYSWLSWYLLSLKLC